MSNLAGTITVTLNVYDCLNIVSWSWNLCLWLTAILIKLVNYLLSPKPRIRLTLYFSKPKNKLSRDRSYQSHVCMLSIPIPLQRIPPLELSEQQSRREDFKYVIIYWTSLVAQTVKRLSIMRETWVWSLGREDPLEKEMTTHSSTLAWKMPWTEEPGRLQSMGLWRVRHTWVTWLHFTVFTVIY